MEDEFRIKALTFCDLRSAEIASEIWYRERKSSLEEMKKRFPISEQVSIQLSPDGFAWYVWDQVVSWDEKIWLKVLPVNRLDEKTMEKILLAQSWVCHTLSELKED